MRKLLLRLIYVWPASLLGAGWLKVKTRWYWYQYNRSVKKAMALTKAERARVDYWGAAGTSYVERLKHFQHVKLEARNK